MASASLSRRRRSFIFKMVVGIPVIWFSVIGFMVVISSGGVYLPQDTVADPRFVSGPESVKPDLHVPLAPPVIEAPNHDRIRLEQAMVRDGAMKLQNQDMERRVRKSERPPQLKRMESPIKVDDVPPRRVIDPNAPGENGKAVNVVKEKLNASELVKFELGWQKNAFNQYVSDMISLHRSLPDVRDAECRSKRYRDMLPDTTVVVVFHNEAWSVLLRTVYSVLERSPAHLIKEIILVDDFSDFPHLGQPLVDYIAKNFTKVKLIRGKKREGLIRARLLGAAAAQGDVITFLDSHCEAAQGWLEPMLDRIADVWSNVVTPVIDVIEDGTFKYLYSSAKSTSVGGFDWNLQFNWHGIPAEEQRRRKGPLDPIRSPTMAGGLFAISRRYFEHIGTYDAGMEIWGGENLEMSFRIWMCGGTLEIIPCSHVGHIFRKRSPYSWKSGVNVVKKNSVRLAEVWMDEYKSYYYERFNNNLGDYGDVSSRVELRKRLKCRSFDWYIKNIYPSLFIPGEAVSSGEIRNVADAQCLDSAVDRHSMQKPVKMWPCHDQGGNQFWMLSKEGEIRRDEGCMDFAGEFLMIYPCHGMKGNQLWAYNENRQLVHTHTSRCIEMSTDRKIHLRTCSSDLARQQWIWQKKGAKKIPARAPAR